MKQIFWYIYKKKFHITCKILIKKCECEICYHPLAWLFLMVEINLAGSYL